VGTSTKWIEGNTKIKKVSVKWKANRLGWKSEGFDLTPVPLNALPASSKVSVGEEESNRQGVRNSPRAS
jgi:hypothetical protein